MSLKKFNVSYYQESKGGAKLFKSAVILVVIFVHYHSVYCVFKPLISQTSISYTHILEPIQLRVVTLNTTFKIIIFWLILVAKATQLSTGDYGIKMHSFS